MCHKSSCCVVFFFAKNHLKLKIKKRLSCALFFAVCPRSDTRRTIGHLAVFGLRPLTLSLSRPRAHPVNAPPPDAPGRTRLRPPSSAPGRMRPQPPHVPGRRASARRGAEPPATTPSAADPAPPRRRPAPSCHGRPRRAGADHAPPRRRPAPTPSWRGPCRAPPLLGQIFRLIFLVSELIRKIEENRYMHGDACRLRIRKCRPHCICSAHCTSA